jgi:hypothetical protein
MDLPNLTTLAALRQPNLRVKKVLCVQIAPRSEHERTAGGRVVLAAMKLSYRHADRVIALSSGVRDELIDIVPALRGRVSVIHNACVDERVLSASSSGEGVPKTSRSVVLAVGRLTEQKGFMDLLEAFHHVRKEHDAELWILGTGPLRDALQRRIHELDLAGSVLMLGFRDNPQDFMRRATVFVLSSHWQCRRGGLGVRRRGGIDRLPSRTIGDHRARQDWASGSGRRHRRDGGRNRPLSPRTCASRKHDCGRTAACRGFLGFRHRSCLRRRARAHPWRLVTPVRRLIGPLGAWRATG